MIETDKGKKEYWNERALEYKDDKKGMVWCSSAIDTHLRWFNRLMDQYKDQEVLDVGCGYGRVSPLFDKQKYHGIDFSEELIKIAKQDYPGYKFEVQNAFEYDPQKQYGIIIAFHLSMMPEREAEFVRRYKMWAREALVIVYADRITIINPKI